MTPDDHLWKILTERISWARSKIDLNVYLLSDVELINAVILAYRKWVSVRIILERSVYGPSAGNSVVYERFKNEGISVVWADEVRQNFNHAKYIIIDSTVYLGTANFTTTSFTKNREFFVETSDVSVFQFMERIFEADFYRFPFHGGEESVYVSPIDARKKIEWALYASTKSIQIFAASLSDDALLDILREKQGAWVLVQVCLPYETGQERQSLTQAFKSQKIDFKQAKSPHIHAKTILIDNQILFIWSENFTKNSLDQNREIGLILQESYFIQKYKETILKDCRDI